MRIAQITGRPLSLQLEAGIADLSGAVLVGGRLFLGNDEGHSLLRCEPDATGRGWLQQESVALGEEGEEIDIEALDYADGYLYVAGSHSLRRKALKPDQLSAAKNRKRFRRVDAQAARDRLFRIPLDPHTGELGEPLVIDLRKRLRKDKLLGPFTRIPGKENGVDIEGLAVHRGRLMLGFRGPVLRHNLVPVMVLDFDDPKRYRLRFVDLRGQGIRDMVSVGDALLLLTGPVGDAPGPFRLWLWDGEDQLPGKDRRISPAVRLGNVQVPAGARAEGLALVEAHGERVELLLVHDGVVNGHARRIALRLPVGDAVR